MSMIGELSYFLGLQIKQMKNGTFVSQGKYIKDMIKKFGLQEAKPMSTPMGTNDQLGSDASGNMVDQKLYRSMIGSLLYVTTSLSPMSNCRIRYSPSVITPYNHFHSYHFTALTCIYDLIV